MWLVIKSKYYNAFSIMSKHTALENHMIQELRIIVNFIFDNNGGKFPIQ